MHTSHLIDPQAVYDDGALYTALGIPATTLARARKLGTLRYTRQGGRTLYLGRWILEWLEATGARTVRDEE